MWGWSFVLLAGIFLWLASRQGPRYALGTTIFLSRLVPAWAVMGYQIRSLGFQPLGIPIDMRVAAGFLGMLACCLRPQSLLPMRMVMVDFLLLMLMAAHVFSDWSHEGFSYVLILRSFGEWAVPYLVGRLSIRDVQDVKRLLPFAASVTFVLAVLAVAEQSPRALVR